MASLWTRRDLIRSSAATAGVAAAMTAASRFTQAHTGAETKATAPRLGEGAVVLFQGDSITDVRRNRKKQDNANAATSLGDGYPLLISSQLLLDHAKLKLKVFNRGISGNKVPDLHQRWQQDCLDLKPALVSILIGVNDIWHKMNGKYDGTVETYQTGFAELLSETRKALPQTRLVICEPFVLRCGAVKDSWFPEFDQRRAAARAVAEQAGATWVPFQTMFNEAVATGTKPQYWAGDGVHPTLAGHALMAKTWRKVVGL